MNFHWESNLYPLTSSRGMMLLKSLNFKLWYNFNIAMMCPCCKPVCDVSWLLRRLVIHPSWHRLLRKPLSQNTTASLVIFHIFVIVDLSRIAVIMFMYVRLLYSVRRDHYSNLCSLTYYLVEHMRHLCTVYVINMLAQNESF